MLFILIGLVAAAFGLLDYFEIVDTPTSLVLTGVGVVTLLAGVGQLQKDKRAKDAVPAPAVAAPATNGHATSELGSDETLATNGAAAPAANGAEAAADEKQSLWKRLNKPVGGSGKAEGKHRSGRREAAEAPVAPAAPVPAPAPAPAPVAAAAPALETNGEGEKVSFWKKLNQPMGKKGAQAAASDDGGKKERRRRKKEEDEGPLFPEHVDDGPDPFASEPQAGAIPPAPVPVAPAGGPTVTEPPAAPDAPASPTPPEAPPQIAASQLAPGVAEGLWEPTQDQPSDDAPLQGTAAGQTSPLAPTAVVEPAVEAPRRGRRVCNYCWEPNEPAATVCSSCGAGL